MKAAAAARIRAMEPGRVAQALEDFRRSARNFSGVADGGWSPKDLDLFLRQFSDALELPWKAPRRARGSG